MVISKPEPPILACAPVIPIDGMPPYVPREGFQRTLCELCDQEVWIGPRQQEQRKKSGLVVCMRCVVLGGARMENVKDLGG